MGLFHVVRRIRGKLTGRPHRRHSQPSPPLPVVRNETLEFSDGQVPDIGYMESYSIQVSPASTPIPSHPIVVRSPRGGARMNRPSVSSRTRQISRNGNGSNSDEGSSSGSSGGRTSSNASVYDGEYTIQSSEESETGAETDDEIRSSGGSVVSSNGEIYRDAMEDGDERQHSSMSFLGSCIICSEDEIRSPVLCIHCKNIIGCAKCVNRWMEDASTCPVCRAEWVHTMRQAVMVRILK